MAKREHHQIIVDFIFGVILGWKNRFSLHCQAIFFKVLLRAVFPVRDVYVYLCIQKCVNT